MRTSRLKLAPMPPAPLSRRTPDRRERGETVKSPSQCFLLFSLFSRRLGGRLGEEGRGDEGSGGAADASIKKSLRIGVKLRASFRVCKTVPVPVRREDEEALSSPRGGHRPGYNSVRA